MTQANPQELYGKLRQLKQSARRLRTVALILLVLNILGLAAVLLLRDQGRFMF